MKIALILQGQKNSLICSYKFGGGFPIIIKGNEKVLKESVLGFFYHARVCVGGTYPPPA